MRKFLLGMAVVAVAVAILVMVMAVFADKQTIVDIWNVATDWIIKTFNVGCNADLHINVH